MNEHQSSAEKLELIWGIGDIAKAIGQSFAATAYMLKQGQIPARKVGDRWVIERGELVAFFKGKAA
ncbi:helix-turn-helix domain-containing protein [Brucella sp. 2280]|uniref:helix-turn-helix domain-containing protein n=1 Tax=Brucella sp. 2280 TaxID=2592625 RepID=UPI001294B556|nr:helix-turn-helix domain-containing protein [Brucella sp. 2280]QGA56890.1 DNA-binding protein [Brucella sp. 2280]